MNAGSVMGILRGGGGIQSLPYTKELIALKLDGDRKTLGASTSIWACA